MKNIMLTACIIIGMSSLSYGQTSAPPYGMNEIEAYSVFRSSVSAEDYETALTYGQWMLDSKIRELQGVPSFSFERELERYVDIYDSMAKAENDPAEKLVHLNKALEIFEFANEELTDEEMDQFDWTMDLARLYQDHSRTFDNGTQSAIDNYIKAYELDARRFNELSDGYFANMLLNYYVSQGNSEDAFAMIEEMEQYATPSMQETIENALNDLYDDPAERITYLESLYEESDDKEGILTEIRDLHEELGNDAEAFEITRQLYELNPNYENTRALADNALDNADYTTAIEYLTEAIDKAPSNADKRDIALEISDTYRSEENFEAARDFARRAIDLDPEHGNSYLSIAYIYASTVSQCTRGRDVTRDDQAVYWLVIDYLQKAADVDSSVRSTANQQINTYKEYSPGRSDILFRTEWEENMGGSITINSSLGQCYGWINEPTTIRVVE